MSTQNISKIALSVTEIGMLTYWGFAGLLALGFITIDPALMYSDYSDPIIVAWNWSFFPIDVLFAVLGLISRFAKIRIDTKNTLATISLALMFCAGLMAVSFWTLTNSFDPTWWAANIWLMVLPILVVWSDFRHQN